MQQSREIHITMVGTSAAPQWAPPPTGIDPRLLGSTHVHPHHDDDRAQVVDRRRRPSFDATVTHACSRTRAGRVRAARRFTAARCAWRRCRFRSSAPPARRCPQPHRACMPATPASTRDQPARPRAAARLTEDMGAAAQFACGTAHQAGGRQTMAKPRPAPAVQRRWRAARARAQRRTHLAREWRRWRTACRNGVRRGGTCTARYAASAPTVGAVVCDVCGIQWRCLSSSCCAVRTTSAYTARLKGTTASTMLPSSAAQRHSQNSGSPCCAPRSTSPQSGAPVKRKKNQRCAWPTYLPPHPLPLARHAASSSAGNW